MKDRLQWLWLIPLLLTISIVALFVVEESRTFIVALILRVVVFVKSNVIALLSAFFLVKGKFILTLFLKKIAFLSATGLGKRYFIEKVINHNLKVHFLDHINDDLKRLIEYIKNNFTSFPILKQIIAIFAFLGSLGFVGKFMGSMLAMKVFIAKIWSFLLAIFLKVGTALVYFFTDYLWGSWIAPIVEIVIFSWLLEWMEKIPLFKRGLSYIYQLFISAFQWTEYYLEKLFHLPVRRFFKYLTTKSKKLIYKFIGYKRVSSWYRLKEIHALDLNKHTLLINKRLERKAQRVKTHLSKREELSVKRAT
ncbi:MAG: hypothetical protein U9O24_04015 [Campylobacterota bacterium]|nr:hypothetical protein [Campylobacterota bacterium]